MAKLTISEVNQSDNGKDLVVLALIGEIDPKTLPKLKKSLNKLVEKELFRIILNMEQTSYVNSSALAVLAKFAKICQNHNGSIAITNVNARVKLPFEMLGLLVFFKFFDSIDEAKQDFLNE
jgi:anti-anti-sigma factor